MLKQLTRKLFIVSVLVACLTLAVPSTPAQGSGYYLSGTVLYENMDMLSYVQSPYVSIYKWNGSSWVYQGYATSRYCGDFFYSTGGPGRFLAEVNGYNTVNFYSECSSVGATSAYMYGSLVVELSAASPSSGGLILAE